MDEVYIHTETPDGKYVRIPLSKAKAWEKSQKEIAAGKDIYRTKKYEDFKRKMLKIMGE